MIIIIVIIKGSEIEKLYRCLEGLNVNQSRSREAVYRILAEESSFLSIYDILGKLANNYPKKVSFNTVYRHLALFVECNLVAILHDNFKRSYYALLDDTPLLVSMCRRCGKIEKLMLESYTLNESLNCYDYITFYKCCHTCRCAREN